MEPRAQTIPRSRFTTSRLNPVGSSRYRIGLSSSTASALILSSPTTTAAFPGASTSLNDALLTPTALVLIDQSGCLVKVTFASSRRGGDPGR